MLKSDQTQTTQDGHLRQPKSNPSAANSMLLRYRRGVFFVKILDENGRVFSVRFVKK